MGDAIKREIERERLSRERGRERETFELPAAGRGGLVGGRWAAEAC